MHVDVGPLGVSMAQAFPQTYAWVSEGRAHYERQARHSYYPLTNMFEKAEAAKEKLSGRTPSGRRHCEQFGCANYQQVLPSCTVEISTISNIGMPIAHNGT